jgi:hypothetical protein
MQFIIEADDYYQGAASVWIDWAGPLLFAPPESEAAAYPCCSTRFAAAVIVDPRMTTHHFPQASFENVGRNVEKLGSTECRFDTQIGRGGSRPSTDMSPRSRN